MKSLSTVLTSVFTAMKGLLRLIHKAFNGVYLGLIFFSMFLIVALVVMINAHVFMRYVLGGGLHWAEEVALILVIWFTFIAMALGVKKDLHISINVLPRKMKAWMNTALLKLKALVILGVALVLVWYGWGLFQTGMRSTLPATGWPSGVQHLAMPVSGALMAFDSFMNLLGLDNLHGNLHETLFPDDEEEA